MWMMLHTRDSTYLFTATITDKEYILNMRRYWHPKAILILVDK